MWSKIYQCRTWLRLAEMQQTLEHTAREKGLHRTFFLSLVAQLHCCWSLGNVQDRYIFLDAGGDQYLGRSVGRLPTSDPKFATLPPHLNVEDAEAIR